MCTIHIKLFITFAIFFRFYCEISLCILFAFLCNSHCRKKRVFASFFYFIELRDLFTSYIHTYKRDLQRHVCVCVWIIHAQLKPVFLCLQLLVAVFSYFAGFIVVVYCCCVWLDSLPFISHHTSCTQTHTHNYMYIWSVLTYHPIPPTPPHSLHVSAPLSPHFPLSQFLSPQVAIYTKLH